MKITTSIELKERISMLKTKEATDRIKLIEHFHATTESLRPFNIIRKIFNKADNLTLIPHNSIGSSLGLYAEILSNKILAGNPQSRFKQILGRVIHLAVASFVTKNEPIAKKIGIQLLKRMVR